MNIGKAARGWRSIPPRRVPGRGRERSRSSRGFAIPVEEPERADYEIRQSAVVGNPVVSTATPVVIRLHRLANLVVEIPFGTVKAHREITQRRVIVGPIVIERRDRDGNRVKTVASAGELVKAEPPLGREQKANQDDGHAAKRKRRRVTFRPPRATTHAVLPDDGH